MTLEAAYDAAGPGIVGYLVATGTDEATALDLLHDAVVRVANWMEGRAGEGRGDNLEALLFTTARNLRANRVRKDARMDFVGEVGEDVPAASAAMPSDAAYLRGRIAAALRSLPDAQREAYVMYQVGGRSVREVAESTGASEGLVKVRLHRAKQSLRRALSDISRR